MFGACEYIEAGFVRNTIEWKYARCLMNWAACIHILLFVNYIGAQPRYTRD